MAANASLNVLVVDDQQVNSDVLRQFLEPLGFTVRAALSGEEALRMVKEEAPDTILLDLVMPGMDGFEVCRHLKEDESTRHIPVIIITGLSDREANVLALELGADDFLSKPFDRILLEARIRSSIRTKRLHDDLLRHRRELEFRVEDRTREIKTTQHVVVFSLARLAESRDTETGDHLERIRCYARELAMTMGQWQRYADQITPEFIGALYESSPLHDIGKVGIPDGILLKPGRLSANEFDVMKTHTLIGGDTLHDADREAGRNSFLAMGRDIAYYHHERWDGSGYPFGVEGENIPLSARITALADVYDALSSRRPYKEPFSHEKSREIIIEGRGSHFDPSVVDAFLAGEQRFMAIRARFQGSGRLAPIQRVTQQLRQQVAAV